MTWTRGARRTGSRAGGGPSPRCKRPARGRLCVLLRRLEPSVQIQGQRRRRQRDDQGARDSEQELEHALRRRRPASEQLPHVRGLPGPRSGSGSQEPGAGREGPAAQSRRRREPRHHADARAKYGGLHRFSKAAHAPAGSTSGSARWSSNERSSNESVYPSGSRIHSSNNAKHCDLRD